MKKYGMKMRPGRMVFTAVGASILVGAPVGRLYLHSLNMGDQKLSLAQWIGEIIYDVGFSILLNFILFIPVVLVFGVVVDLLLRIKMSRSFYRLSIAISYVAILSYLYYLLLGNKLFYPGRFYDHLVYLSTHIIPAVLVIYLLPWLESDEEIQQRKRFEHDDVLDD